MVAFQRATLTNCSLLLEWANDPDVRRGAFHSAPIEWNEHVQWLTAQLSSAASAIWLVIGDDGAPVGHVRLWADGQGGAMVSISIRHDMRRRGFGLQALSLLPEYAHEFLAFMGIRYLYAFIRPDNVASLAVFRRAGYTSPRPVIYEDQPAMYVEWAGMRQV